MAILGEAYTQISKVLGEKYEKKIENKISEVSFLVDSINKQIISKVWESDYVTYLNSYDETTGKQLRDRVTKTELDINGVNTTISDVQTDISTKAGYDEVQALTIRLNETNETVSLFQRTISENYATQNSLSELESSITQLTTSISTKVSENDVKSLVNQQKNYWRADFEENGALCGSILFDKSGITVGDGDAGYTTKITPTEFGGYYYGNRVFYLNQDETVTERLRVKKGVDLTNMKITPTIQSNIKGIDFLSSGALLI